MDSTLTTVLCSAATALVTLLLTKGPEAWARLRGVRGNEVKYEDDRADKGYQFVIGELKTRTSNLETILIATQKDHLDCIKIQAGLHVQNLELQGQVAQLREEVKTLRERLTAEEKR